MSSRPIVWPIFFGICFTLVRAGPPISYQNLTNSTKECHRPSLKRGVEECCKIPVENIWGDMTISLQACGRKMRHHIRSPLERIHNVTTIPPDKGLPTTTVDTDTDETTVHPKTFQGKPTHGVRFLETFKESLESAYEVFKAAVHYLQDSIVLITDKNYRRGHKECFMECVFHEEGFFVNNKIDKAIITTRLKMSAGDNEEWQEVALSAAEKCFQKDFESSANSLCPSGSYELFQCIFREIFYNCPSWAENDEFCTLLKKYYEKCPDSSPPSIDKLPMFVNGENGTDGR